MAALRSRLAEFGLLGSCFSYYLAARLDLLTTPAAREVIVDPGRPEALPDGQLVELLRNDLQRDPGDAFAAFEKAPFDISLRFQWHRARLHTGERAVIKVVRPELSEQLGAGLDRLEALRRHLVTLCGEQASEAVPAFRLHLERSLDLAREADDLVRLNRDAERIALLTAPDVISDLSGERCLTTLAVDGSTASEMTTAPGRGGPGLTERLARRLARLWFSAALSGSPYPEEPQGRNVRFLADGRIAFCGGRFHTVPWGSRQHLLDYLAASAVGDHEQIAASLLELTERRSAAMNRRLRHQLRHSEPLRDGQWDSDSDRLSRVVFSHWHRSSAIGFRTRPELSSFLAGLARLTEEIGLLVPGSSVLHVAFQEYRLRLLLSEFDDISERQQWLEIARDQARFLSELPRKLDRVLSIAAETEATATPEHRAERQSGSSLVLGGLLAAMGAIALLVHHFGEQQEWVEPVGALILLLTGGLALASATRA
jgi:hypothetical protein